MFETVANLCACGGGRRTSGSGASDLRQLEGGPSFLGAAKNLQARTY